MKRMLLICLAALLLLGCLPTPEEEIVSEKDFDRMIEKAKASPAPEVAVVILPGPETSARPESGADDSPDGAEPEGERIRETFTGRTDRFSVEIDAEVVRPDAALPIVRVTPGEIDDAFVQRCFDVLCAGKRMYPLDELNTKSILEKEIEHVLRDIDEAEAARGTPLFAEDSLKDSQHWLKELQKQYKTAPDTLGAPTTEAHLVWNEPTKYTDHTNGSFSVFTEDQRASFHASTNWVSTKKNDAASVNLAYVSYSDMTLLTMDETSYCPVAVADVSDSAQVPARIPIKLTPEQARSRAAALLTELGISDMTPTQTHLMYSDGRRDERGMPHYVEKNVRPENYYYEIHFSRNVNGVRVARPASETSSGDEATPRPRWQYEGLSVSIGDNGILSFYYGAPLVLGETVVKDAALLPFDKITETARKMLPILYEYKLSDTERYPGLERIACRVTRIELCLQRIAEPDNINGGLLAPVWNFWGEANETYPTHTSDAAHGSPLLCINAVSGSIIDPLKGY